MRVCIPSRLQRIAWLTATGSWLVIVASCERKPSNEESSKEPTSLLVPKATVSAPIDTALQALIDRALSSESPEGLVEELQQRTPEALLAALSALPTVDGLPGEKGGLAAVIVSVLAEKSPAACVRYLTSRKSPYGLHRSEGGVLALRQAMEAWAQQSPREAFARLGKLSQDPDMNRVLTQISRTHGETLALSMVGAMPINDTEALHRAWTNISRKEVGAVLERHLEKVTTPDEREEFMDQTAQWVTEQWREEGPQAVSDWAVGVAQESLRDEVLARVTPPSDDDATP